MTSEKQVAIRETPTLSREQIELVKHTVAVGASDSELQLFLYQAKKRGLDPLTRQIYFIKRKQYNPDTEKYEEVGTIQTGIDGFRVVADRTGKLVGIKRGAIKDDKGKLIGAWAEVYRSDWSQVAREEVSFDEYCQKKKDGSPIRLWATMPETMIKKVAEAAALRMAFPEDLSGIYSHEEMQQADSELIPIAKVAKLPSSPLEAPQAKTTAGEPPVAEEADQQEEEAVLPNGINLAEVRQQLHDLQWTPHDLNETLNRVFKPLHFRVAAGHLDDLKKLSREQAVEFVAMLEERRRMK